MSIIVSDCKTNKRMLRDQIKEKRLRLSKETIRLCGQCFLKRLERWPVYLQAGTVMIYIAVRGEAETSFIAADVLDRRKKLLVPVCQPEEGRMFAAELHSLDELSSGNFGIPEPDIKSSHLYDPQQIDLIIVPCLACSKEGDRLGYGGGYYDKFLSQCSSDCEKTALLYYFQLLDNVPAEDHDVRLDYLITPSEIINVNL